MMNKATDYPFTFGAAVATLERVFNASYIGTCKPDYISHDERDEVWYRFECATGNDRIVADSQLFQLANAYAS